MNRKLPNLKSTKKNITELHGPLRQDLTHTTRVPEWEESERLEKNIFEGEMAKKQTNKKKNSIYEKHLPIKGT